MDPNYVLTAGEMSLSSAKGRSKFDWTAALNSVLDSSGVESTGSQHLTRWPLFNVLVWEPKV